LQVVICLSASVQATPPFETAVAMDRVRIWVPVAQLALHTPQLLQFE
jgi:hypothetical protein